MPQLYNSATSFQGGAGLSGPGLQQGISPSDVFQKQQNVQLANIAQTPALLQQQRFNQLFPWLQGELGGLMGKNPYTIGGGVPAGPEISTSPVLNPQQIQQQVNTQTAANNQNVAAQTKAMQQSLAGRGISQGASSPLAAALGSNMQNANMAANTANETNTRLQAAQMNAQQVFNEQQAKQAQFATQQQLEIARAQPYFQQTNALIAALAGMI